MDRERLRQQIARNLGILVVKGSVAASPAPTASAFKAAEFVGLPPAALVNRLLTMTTGTKAGEESTIAAFDDATWVATLLQALSGAPTAADKFEVYSLLRKVDLDNAIAEAVNSVRQLFFTVKTDRTLFIRGVKAAPTITQGGTAGKTRYDYVVEFIEGGKTKGITLPGTTSTGNATLGAVNKNIITWAIPSGTDTQKVYRAVGGAAQGLISTIANGTTATLDDTGLAGGGESIPNPYEYAVPSGFIYIHDLVIETPSGVFQLVVPSAHWELIQGASIRLLDTYSAYEGYRLEIQGHAYPTAPSAETDTIALPDEYVIAYCSWLLGLQRPVGFGDKEGWTKRVDDWKASALQTLSLEMRRPRPGSRRVP